MSLIDTHCHLYLEDFDADLKTVIERAEQNGVNKIFLPAIDTGTHERLLKLCQLSAANCQLFPMMGLHPCSVKENFEEELKVVEQYLDRGKFYAIGEIGLDYYWDLSFKEQQIIAFERQIEWSVNRNLPVAIHSRNSTGDCIEIVRKFGGKAKGIFHCFGGTLEQAREIIDLGMYMGIGGVVTYKKTDLRETLLEVGLDNVVLETDAPYLTPVPHRGKRNEPAHIKLICAAIADALGRSFEEVAEITTKNALKVFQLN
ncbi:MAG: TatD family hydrolase [Bacteroidetes bacterium]|nr:TatD family hydrolase [Bacteroidota bacterium]